MSLSVFDIASSRMALGRSSFFVMGPGVKIKGTEEEEEGAVVDVGVSDSEEELEVLQQPNLIQKLADVVRLRASCVIELEGGAQLTIRPATQRRRPPPPTKRLLYYPVPGWLTLAPPAPLSPDHARDSTITVAVRVLDVAARSWDSVVV